METRLPNIFKTTSVTNFTKTILKSYKSSISYIQIENTKTTRLLFKGRSILLYFLTFKLAQLWLHFGKSCKTTKFRKPTEVSQNASTVKSFKFLVHPRQNGGPVKSLQNWTETNINDQYFQTSRISDIWFNQVHNMSKIWFANKFKLLRSNKKHFSRFFKGFQLL